MEFAQYFALLQFGVVMHQNYRDFEPSTTE
jgi:hypothetical protein